MDDNYIELLSTKELLRSVEKTIARAIEAGNEELLKYAWSFKSQLLIKEELEQELLRCKQELLKYKQVNDALQQQFRGTGGFTTTTL